MSIEPLYMDAVRLEVIGFVSATVLFPYVLSTPLTTNMESGHEYALLVNRPIALQVEIGQLGERHLELLIEALSKGENPDHLRTDGLKVWVPINDSLVE